MPRTHQMHELRKHDLDAQHGLADSGILCQLGEAAGKQRMLASAHAYTLAQRLSCEQARRSQSEGSKRARGESHALHAG